MSGATMKNAMKKGRILSRLSRSALRIINVMMAAIPRYRNNSKMRRPSGTGLLFFSGGIVAIRFRG